MSYKCLLEVFKKRKKDLRFKIEIWFTGHSDDYLEEAVQDKVTNGITNNGILGQTVFGR